MPPYPYEMDQAMISALSPSTWTAITLSLIISFASGYAYRWHQDSLKDAKKEAKQEAVTTTSQAAVTVTDKQGIARLESQLAATKLRAANLEQMIKELQNANPNPSIDCTLPAGLRDQINLDLAGRTR